MSSAELTSFELNAAPHPGETVVEYLEFHGWSQRDLARRTGLTPKTISEICNGKAPITPSTALAFEGVLQRPAHFWMNLQSQYDEAEARNRRLAKSLEWSDWAKTFPLKEMKRLKFSLPETSSEVEALLQFFGVASPESWRAVWAASSVAYRQTRMFKIQEEAVAAWVRETEIVASALEVADFDEERLRDSLATLRQLTREPADQIIDSIQSICASAGVAVVLVPALQQTAISGYARWLSNKRALVGLTLRYRTDDQLWFTFFHEIAHILLHRHRRSFVVDNAADTLVDRVVDPEMEQYEAEANRFAADTLIPPTSLHDFVRKGSFTNESIHSFAETIGVGPGIVVGRLQHDGILKHHQGNALKQKLGWGFTSER